MENELISVLGRIGKPLEQQVNPDGSRLLLLPHGARVLALFGPGSDENFFWTHPALSSDESARSFFQASDWHNTGGDRTWLAPEVDIFFPNYPDTAIWRVPAELDPGNYAAMRTDRTTQFTSEITVGLSRCQEKVAARITKSWGPAPNPLRHEQRWKELSGICFAGYTQETCLELLAGSGNSIGLWNLLAVPSGGEVIIPTHARTEPEIYSGSIASLDLIVTDHLVRFRTAGVGIRKIGIRAAVSTGRLGYLYQGGDGWALVIRNFAVNPSGEYVDVPWQQSTGSNALGYSTQACSVQTELGDYCELEYHVPAIGFNIGQLRSCDTSQVWAFRGSESGMRTVARMLLSAVHPALEAVELGRSPCIYGI
jgi:hypothetical protein